MPLQVRLSTQALKRLADRSIRSNRTMVGEAEAILEKALIARSRLEPTPGLVRTVADSGPEPATTAA